MGGGKGKSPSSPELKETPTWEEEGEPTSVAIRDAEALKLRRMKGAAGTILTSPLGVTGDALYGTAKSAAGINKLSKAG